MITLFTSPKPFVGKAKTHQLNALGSWMRLRPRPEIMVFGPDDEAARVCNELGIRHFSNVRCTDEGTPLLDDIFEKAQQHAMHQIVCYINCDIILLDDFLLAIQRLCAWGIPFLGVGSRWEISLERPLEFDHDWQRDLLSQAAAARERTPLAADFFVFPRGSFSEVSPFAVGRTAFDNWLIWKARQRGLPVVDMSDAINVLHQKHSTANDWIRIQSHPEVARNRKLAGRWSRSFTVLDATHRLVSGEIRRLLFRPFRNRMRALHEIGREVVIRSAGSVSRRIRQNFL